MGYFSRVKKIEVKGKEEKEAEVATSKKGSSKKKEAGNVSPWAKDTDRDEEGKRKKKKYRLQPHEHQKFFDSSEDVSSDILQLCIITIPTLLFMPLIFHKSDFYTLKSQRPTNLQKFIDIK